MKKVDESQFEIGTSVALDYWTTSSRMYRAEVSAYQLYTELHNHRCNKVSSSLTKQALMAFEYNLWWHERIASMYEVISSKS